MSVIVNPAAAGSSGVTSISAGNGITLTPNPIIATGTVAVTTQALLNTTLFTDVLAAGPTQGDLIIGNATPKWARFAGDITNTRKFLRTLSIAGVAQVPVWDTLVVGDVPTHNILSATHGDTLAATVVRGDLIIGNSTPAWSRLIVGANGTVFQSNGTDPSWNSNLTAVGGTHNLGAAGVATTLTVGQGTTGTDAATLAVNSGNLGTPAVVLKRNASTFANWSTDGTNVFFDFGIGSANLRFRTTGAGRLATLGSGGLLAVGGVTDPTAGIHILTNGTVGHLRMDGIAGDPGVPTAGDWWYNTTQKSLRGQEAVGTAGLVGLLKAITAASTTISGTSTETAFSNGTFAFPANSLTVGKTIRVTAGGIYSSAATPGTILFELRYGTVNTDPLLSGSFNITMPASQTNNFWGLTCWFTVRTASASGLIWGDGLAWVASTSAGTMMPMGANSTIDTTVAKTMSLFVKFSLTTASITLETFTVEVLD